jgi:hypothetical protein
LNGSPSIEHQVALKLISNDMIFARRFIDGVLIRQKEKQTTTLILIMSRYLALYIYESHNALRTVDPQLADKLEVDNAEIIERSRHTNKLFDDTNDQLGGASGVTSQFGGIAEVHRDYFLDYTWFPPAKVLETDLAEYRFRRRLIATTHTISFHLGLPPETIKDRKASGEALLSLGKGQSSYVCGFLNNTAQAEAWRGTSFMAALDLRGVKNQDIRADKFYSAAFDPGLSDEAVAALVAFQCSMNFLALVVAEEPNPDSAEATFKLKLVTLYHVLSSLAKFKAAFGASLTPASSRALDAILGHPTSVLLTEQNMTKLRNTLMHYVPRGPVVAQVTLSQPLCGLVEAYYPNYDFAGMSKLVGDHTELVAGLLDGWSARGR